jgi:hypothetical protein
VARVFGPANVARLSVSAEGASSLRIGDIMRPSSS